MRRSSTPSPVIMRVHEEDDIVLVKYPLIRVGRLFVNLDDAAESAHHLYAA
jgi:hypothetical protein